MNLKSFREEVLRILNKAGVKNPESLVDETLKAYYPKSPKPEPREGEPQVRHERSETEILAWRSWKINPLTGQLGSIHQVRGEDWEGPVTHADHKPEHTSACGIYARKTPEALQPDYTMEPVHGEVALSGVVLEGETGYRAQACTIRRLWLNTERLEKILDDDTSPLMVLERMEERYQCPVEFGPAPGLERGGEVFASRPMTLGWSNLRYTQQQIQQAQSQVPPSMADLQRQQAYYMAQQIAKNQAMQNVANQQVSGFGSIGNVLGGGIQGISYGPTVTRNLDIYGNTINP